MRKGDYNNFHLSSSRTDWIYLKTKKISKDREFLK